MCQSKERAGAVSIVRSTCECQAAAMQTMAASQGLSMRESFARIAAPRVVKTKAAPRAISGGRIIRLGVRSPTPRRILVN